MDSKTSCLSVYDKSRVVSQMCDGSRQGSISIGVLIWTRGTATKKKRRAAQYWLFNFQVNIVRTLLIGLHFNNEFLIPRSLLLIG